MRPWKLVHDDLFFIFFFQIICKRIVSVISIWMNSLWWIFFYRFTMESCHYSFCIEQFFIANFFTDTPRKIFVLWPYVRFSFFFQFNSSFILISKCELIIYRKNELLIYSPSVVICTIFIYIWVYVYIHQWTKLSYENHRVFVCKF